MIEPHLFRGFAAVWGALYAPDDSGARLIVPRGSLRLPAGAVDLHCGHDRSRAFASTSDGSLVLRDSAFGVTCEYTPRATHSGLSLVRSLAHRAFNGLSFTLLIHDSDLKDHAGERIETVRHAEISELSIVVDPLCPTARCWPAGLDHDDLPADLRLLARRWAAGYHSHLPSARRAPPAAPPAGLHRASAAAGRRAEARPPRPR